jgi:hypothetical protein
VRRFASRKFIVTVLALLSASVLYAMGHIHEGVYSTVMVASVGAYLAANVTQKATVKDSNAATPQT